MFSLVACGSNRDAAGRDSTATANVDSLPGDHVRSGAGMMPNDSMMRRDSMSGMSMSTDNPNRGADRRGQRRP